VKQRKHDALFNLSRKSLDNGIFIRENTAVLNSAVFSGITRIECKQKFFDFRLIEALPVKRKFKKILAYIQFL
jgi:acyl-[acyl carrier protein]--UDP-N-acetylglucosamine O-acyltransferase